MLQPQKLHCLFTTNLILLNTKLYDGNLPVLPYKICGLFLEAVARGSQTASGLACGNVYFLKPAAFVESVSQFDDKARIHKIATA